MKFFKRTLVTFLSLIFVGCSLTYAVNASWGTGQGRPSANDASATFTKVVQNPVAKYTYNSTTYYFPTIEGAVSSANSRNATIEVKALVSAGAINVTSSFTINSSVTLTLPYSDDDDSSCIYKIADTNSSAGGTTAYDSTSGDGCSVSDVYTKYASNCVLTVNVSSGVTITNNGKIYIGGVQSGGGGGYVSGHIKGPFTKIVLNGSASIVSPGKLINFGYIVGNNSTGTLNLSGSTYIPFVLVEHRGGSNFTVLKQTDNLKGSPFNRFFFPSFIDVTAVFSSSSIVKGIPDLYANSQHNRDLVSLIGSGALIAPGTGFSLVANFTFETYSGTKKMPKHTFDFYGAVTLNSLSITVQANALISVTMSTSSVYFPVSCYYDINFHVASGASSAAVSFGSQKVKFLPGSNVVIDQNVTVTSPGTAVYKKDSCSDLTGAAGAVSYEKTNVDASMVVNGYLNSTILVGYIDTASPTGKVNCSTRTATMYEVSSTDKGTYSILGQTITGALYYSFSMSARGPISKSTGERIEGDLPTGTTNASSLGDRWNITLSSSLTSVTFSSASNSYASGATSEGSYTLNASIVPSDPDDFDESYGYHWTTSDTSNSKFGGSSGTSTATGQSVTFWTAAKSDSGDATLTVTVTVKNTSGTIFTHQETFTRTGSSSGGSCLLPSTLVTMADGSLKAVRDIVAGDMVKVFNHETGQIDVAPITFNDHDNAALMNVMYCRFSNGKSVGVIYEHGFFDLDTMRYEYIREDNYSEFIGHRFYTEEGGEAILTSVDVRQEYTECYSPTSFYHFDYFVEGMLSMPGGITGLFNIFEYGEDLKYDEEAYNRDIELYGLFTYEDLAPLGVTEIMFEAYAGKYLKVALGKGILTEEYLMYLIERYGGFTD